MSFIWFHFTGLFIMPALCGTNKPTDEYVLLYMRVYMCLCVQFLITFFSGSSPLLPPTRIPTVLFGCMVYALKFAASAACCSGCASFCLFLLYSQWVSGVPVVDSLVTYEYTQIWLTMSTLGHCSCDAGRIKTIFCSFRTFFRRFGRLLALIYLLVWPKA